MPPKPRRPDLRNASLESPFAGESIVGLPVVRALVFGLVACGLLAVLLPGPALLAQGAVTEPAQTTEGRESDASAEDPTADEVTRDRVIQDLEAAAGDSEKSAVAASVASSILSTILDSKPNASIYRRYLEHVLDPEHLTREARSVPIAEKLIATMGVGADQGQPLPGGADLLLPLVGIGPEALRSVLRESLLSFVRSERRSGSSSTFDALGRRLLTNSPPPPEILSEVSRILRELDPKALVGLLVEGMLRNNTDSDGHGARTKTRVYILELRELLLLDLQSVDAWRLWWEQHRSRSYQEIRNEAIARFHETRVALWTKSFQRLRESNNPERYLGVVFDTFELDFTRPMRLAALGALGAFPDWLRDTRFPEEIPGVGAIDETARARFLTRGIEFLLEVISDLGATTSRRRHVSREVRAAALACLRSFNGFAVREPALRERLVEIVVAQLGPGLRQPLQSLGADSWGDRNRGYGIELVRTAGALRLDDPRIVEALESVVDRDPDAWPADEELLTETVASLGRLIEKSVSERTVNLLVTLYERSRSSAAKSHKDLRRACIMALNLPIASESVRERVRALYSGILERADQAERIPAIVGLGILAKAGDAASVEQLKDALARREQFDPSEVGAVIDALAYLGGSQALECFLDFLGSADKPFVDQVWSKVATLLQGGKQELYAWLIQRLESRSFDRGLREFAPSILRLCEQPGFAEFLNESAANLEDRAAFLRYWGCAKARVHALEVVGRDGDAAAGVEQLSDVVVKNEKVKEFSPGVSAEVEQARKRLLAKAAVGVALRKSPRPPPGELAALFVEVVRLSADGAGAEASRGVWRGLVWSLEQLEGLKPSPASQELAAEATAALTSPELAELWSAVPSAHVERFGRRVESLKSRLKTDEADTPRE